MRNEITKKIVLVGNKDGKTILMDENTPIDEELGYIALYRGFLEKLKAKYRCTRGTKQDKIEMRGDRAEMSDFPLYLNTVAGGLDCRDQTIGGFSFVVKIYALPVVEIIG